MNVKIAVTSLLLLMNSSCAINDTTKIKVTTANSGEFKGTVEELVYQETLISEVDWIQEMLEIGIQIGIDKKF